MHLIFIYYSKNYLKTFFSFIFNLLTSLNHETSIQTRRPTSPCGGGSGPRHARRCPSRATCPRTCPPRAPAPPRPCAATSPCTGSCATLTSATRRTRAQTAAPGSPHCHVPHTCARVSASDVPQVPGAASLHAASPEDAVSARL